MSHMNLVRFLANKFKNRGEPLDDLMQVGYLGLLKAIDRFDLSADSSSPRLPRLPSWARLSVTSATRLERARAPSLAGALGQGQPGYR